MRSLQKITLLSCFVAPLALVGCGGGSGGPAGPGGVAKDFVKFPLAANTPTKLAGKGREASFNQNGVSAFAPGDVSAEVVTDADNDVTSLSLKTASNGTMTWNKSNASVSEGFGDRLLQGESNDGDRIVAVGNPASADNQFEYQTYGGWMDEGTGKVGVFSVGVHTAAADIPTTASATFKGTAGGIYHDGVNDPQTMTADAELDVDFANSKASFKTSSTVLETGANDDLNLSAADLAISGGAFSGQVKTADDSMSGDVDGRFYGTGANAAKEVGGTFALTGGTSTMIGGYGAVKQ